MSKNENKNSQTLGYQTSKVEALFPIQNSEAFEISAEEIFSDPQAYQLHAVKLYENYEYKSEYVVVLNAYGLVVYANRAVTDTLLVSRDDLIGECWLTRFVPEYQRSQILMLFDNMMIGNSIGADVYRHDIRFSNTKTIKIEWRNLLVRGDDEQVLGLLSSGVDIRS